MSSRLEAQLSSRSLVQNYKIIHQVSGRLPLLPMVKAEAYGHGAQWVVQTLKSMPHLVGFGVATLAEGAVIRETLKSSRVPVIAFSGSAPWTEEKGRFCQKHGLTPVIVSEADWKRFCKGGWHKKISYELKFNTGMNRLGIPMEFVPEVVQSLRVLRPEHRPQAVLSHLAEAENPMSQLSRLQKKNLIELHRIFKSRFPSTRIHLGNSSAIWNAKAWGLAQYTDFARPGLSLYGIAPWAGAPSKGLQAVMTLKAMILEVQVLKAGASVGYGGAYLVRKNEVIATLGVGYADGVHRLLGNKGQVVYRKKICPMVGRVSMDLVTIRVGHQAKVGDQVILLGSEIDPWKQAQAAGTIPYELLTSVTFSKQRISRKYE